MSSQTCGLDRHLPNYDINMILREIWSRLSGKEEEALNSASQRKEHLNQFLRDQEKLARGMRWQWALNAQRTACAVAGRGELGAGSGELGAGSLPGWSHGWRDGGGGSCEKGRQGSQQGGSTFEGVLSTTKLCYRKLTQAALKGSFVWGQERNEKAEAVMGKGEDRTDSKHLLSS